MWKLLPIVIFALAFAGLTEYYSVSRIEANGMKVYEKKANLYYYIMAIAMAVFVGLRTACNDTETYLVGYRAIKAYGSFFDVFFRDFTLDIGNNFGFVLVQRLLKFFHFSEQSFLMVFALFTNLTYLWFIKKHACDITLTVFYFISMGCYTFSMASIKQCAATAFCLIAVDYAIKKKFFLFAFFIFFAVSMHQFALIYAIVPFLSFVPWTKKTYLFLAIFIVVAVFFRILLGGITDFASNVKSGGYSDDSFTRAGVNIFRVAVVWVPVVLSYMVKDRFILFNRAESMIVNLSMVNAAIMFLGLFGTANYFARLANYFLIFQSIALPYILRLFDDDRRKELTILSLIGYTVFFVYSTVFANAMFDKDFYKITIWQYFGRIFS